MRISDWSSDVCSSDLEQPDIHGFLFHFIHLLHDHLQTASTRGGPHVHPARGRSDFLAHAFVQFTDHRLPVFIFDEAYGVATLEGRYGRPFGRPEAHYMRSEEHTSELQSLLRISYAVFCLKKKHTLTQQPQH